MFHSTRLIRAVRPAVGMKSLVGKSQLQILGFNKNLISNKSIQFRQSVPVSNFLLGRSIRSYSTDQNPAKPVRPVRPTIGTKPKTEEEKEAEEKQKAIHRGRTRLKIFIILGALAGATSLLSSYFGQERGK